MSAGAPWIRRLELAPDQPREEIASFEAGGLSGDQPAVQDLLGVGHYAEALARFVLHPETDPLVIGIHGPWGQGKSTFMGFVNDVLVNGRRAGDPEVASVEFNAWRFQDAHEIWAGLASEITKGIESRLGILQKLRLRWRHAWSKNRGEIVAFAVTVVVAAALAAGAVWDESVSGALGATDKTLTAALSLGGLGSIAVLLWRIPHLLQPLGQRVLEYAQLPTYKEHMGYQHLVLDDIRRVYSVWRGKRDPSPRVVVFIDDLDRCSNDKIVEILQAIHLILGSSQFYVFLGVASDMLLNAIRLHYSEQGNQLDADFPNRYLEKIVQLSFRLPELTPEQQEPLITSMFSPESRQSRQAAAAEPAGAGGESEGVFRVDLDALADPNDVDVPGIGEPVRDTEHELAAFLDLHRFLGDNPRVKKQVVNVHRLVKILLQGEGASWTPEQQQRLVRWLIFCERWPDEAEVLLSAAPGQPDDADVHRTRWLLAAEDEPEEGSLEDFANSGPAIPASALVPGGTLRRATEISRMARNRAAPE